MNSNTARVDAQRAEFAENARQYLDSKICYDNFVMGYDDCRCGRPKGYRGSHRGGQAYDDGYELARKQRGATAHA